jgi:hypothetical protein
LHTGHLGGHALVPHVEIFKVAWEAIDQKFAGAALLHGGAKEGDGDGRGHNFAFLDVVVDHLRGLGLAIPLCPQEVTCREVFIAKVLDDARAVGPLAGAWAAEDEDDVVLEELRDASVDRFFWLVCPHFPEFALLSEVLDDG